MPDAFVPISSPTTATAAQAFTPLQFKTVAPGAPKPPAPAQSGSAAAPPSPANCATPKVTLQRQGDIVTGIVIQCSCGQVIELTCSY